MNSRKWWLITVAILVVSFGIRVFPLLSNNFYFTMDQGVDAIHAREIWVGHHISLIGPESSFSGLYAGPLWHYFIAVGYFLFGGSPVGPVVFLILLNTLLTFLIIRKISNEVSPKVGLLVGAMLLVSWSFYDSSRYAFNPFPNVFLGFLAIFLLADFLKGDPKKYIMAAIPIGLFFHTDLAPAAVVSICYFGLGLFALFKRRLKFSDLAYGALLVGLFLLPHLLSELKTGFSQTNSLVRELNNPSGVFSSNQFNKVSENNFLIKTRAIFSQIGLLGLLLTITLFVRKPGRRVNQFSKNFAALSVGLFLISWLFFASNLGWRDWHTNFLSTIIFVSVILALSELKSYLFIPLLLYVFLTHSQYFLKRYTQSVAQNGDPSILANEMKAIDWSYSRTNSKSLAVYVWIPSVFDYHYEYLYWWYGKNKHGYFPCELNTFPGSPKTYLSRGYEKYEKPRGSCPAKSVVLIMEPDKNGQIDQAWYGEIIRRGSVVERTTIGKLRLEKLDLR